MLLYICYPKYGSCCPMWKSNINFLLILFIIFFSLTVSTASASVVTLSWDAPTTNADGTPLTDLAGYKIYWGSSQNNYPNSKVLTNPGLSSAVVDQLTPATWYFVVTAYDAYGNESAYSNVATKTVM